ncbi:transcription factor tfiiib complex subunit brf1 [Diplodia corticola]|uniref:Transcription factor tfiiib complex subunit brf1 n=1 Tax=Diplodia corticola TaxID=236234 RepID=A0A1J9SJ76_9PEZI|nr:transcription factor tfiiib complex subunit brf1 [Diplodia corticola]OJD39804.1 transcription factor tfiiib complex subunit brf1 [Diplodia corticola]
MSAIPRPRPPRERLSSLKDAGKTRPVGTLPPRSKPKRQTCCANPTPEDMDGVMVCTSCGNVINESHIVSEVSFGETSSGAAMVQGGFVGDEQRHANTMGSSARRLGLGGSDGRSTAESNGQDAIRGLMTALRMTGEGLEGQAMNIYRLAAKERFTHGRRPIVIAACCLYYVCRTKRDNKYLLIDFAEKIKLNVFKLGETYKELLSKLFISDPSKKDQYAALEPEPLIKKYVDKLEFGEVGGRKVAEDAVKILKRMKRDWMVEGRQPAGICGACIILAARMNNFRRTVREVVYVVKVADMTIAKRLVEFKRTQSGQLTVNEFRTNFDALPDESEPPSVYQARERAKKRRKLTSAEAEAENLSESGSRQASVAPDPSQEPRRDADGFLIPTVPASMPIDPSLLAATNLAVEELQAGEGTPEKRRPGRPRKSKDPPPPVADEDLAVEQEIEEEIENILHDPEVNNVEDVNFALVEARSKALANQMRGEQRAPETEIVEDHEFDDDPEVANCLLSPAEIAIKERIWVTHNHDWLREQQAKMLKKALEEANGGPKKKKPRKKVPQLGDMSEYTRDSPIHSAADGMQRMVQRRGKGFSRNINYEKLNALMGKNEPEASQTSSSRPSNSGSPDPSEASLEYEEEPLDGPVDPQQSLVTPPVTQQSQGGQQQQQATVINDEENDESEVEEDQDVDDTAAGIGLAGLTGEGEFDEADDWYE